MQCRIKLVLLAFKGYAMSYKVEIVEKKKDLIVQIEASKSSIKDCLMIF